MNSADMVAQAATDARLPWDGPDADPVQDIRDEMKRLVEIDDEMRRSHNFPFSSDMTGVGMNPVTRETVAKMSDHDQARYNTVMELQLRQTGLTPST